MTAKPVNRLLWPNELPEVVVGDIPGYIAGVLEPLDRLGFSLTKQTIIEQEHHRTLQEASLAGIIVGRNPLTREKQPGALGEQLKRSLLPILEAIDYFSKFGITLEISKEPEETGRYMLEAAAKCIANATGESEKDLQTKLYRCGC